MAFSLASNNNKPNASSMVSRSLWQADKPVVVPVSRPIYGTTRPGNSGIMEVPGRGNVAVPQSLVVEQAIVHKEEVAIRANRNGRLPPNQLLAPHATEDAVMNTYKGQLGLTMIERGTTFRGGLGNNPTVRFVTSANGLSKADMANLGIPGVAQVERDATDKTSEDRTTVVLHGVQTLVNTSNDQINIGDKLYVDPSPLLTTDGSGRVVSAIRIRGIHPETCHFRPRPKRANTVFAWEHDLVNRAREEMGRGDFGKSLQLAVQHGDAQVLYEAIDKTCARVLDVEGGVSDNSPMRWHVRLCVYALVVSLAMTPGALHGLNDLNARLTTWVLALQAQLEALRVWSASEERIQRDFQATLPQHTRPMATRSGGGADIDETIHSSRLSALLAPQRQGAASIPPEQRLAAAMEAQARLALHSQHAITVTSHAAHDWLNKFYLGTALSSANKGQAFDVLMG